MQKNPACCEAFIVTDAETTCSLLLREQTRETTVCLALDFL